MQRDRATAKHCAWLFSLCRASASHHTRVPLLSILADIRDLRAELVRLGTLVDRLSKGTVPTAASGQRDTPLLEERVASTQDPCQKGVEVISQVGDVTVINAREDEQPDACCSTVSDEVDARLMTRVREALPGVFSGSPRAGPGAPARPCIPATSQRSLRTATTLRAPRTSWPTVQPMAYRACAGPARPRRRGHPP